MNILRRTKRFLAVALSLVMVLGVLSGIPFTVAAETGNARLSFDALEFYDGGTLSGDAYGVLDENKSNGVRITREQLFAPLRGRTELKGVDYTEATVALTDAFGSAAAYDHAKLTEEGIFFQTDRVGAETFYYTVTVDGTGYGPVPIRVYTYGVADSVFVLDYSLPVELYAGEHGFTSNDILYLAANPDATCKPIATDGKKGSYGDFDVAEGSLVYTMKEFMNGVDTMEIRMEILAPGATEVTDATTGVVLTQTVTVAPANVMYYEDDFDGITYVNTGSDASGNIWAVYEGTGVGTEQSADQTLNYGQDPNYAVNQTDIYGDLELSYLEHIRDHAILEQVGDDICKTTNRELFEEGIYTDADIFHALYGDASNDTLHAMSIHTKTAAELLSFTFRGTGFELVGRTTYYAYAVLTVKIENLDNGTVKAIPVITESIAGDLTQVPFVARKGLELGNYKVTVYGSNFNEADRMVYIDGVRVYQPLTVEESAPLYKPDESVADFHEIKTEIAKGTVVYGQISGDMSDSLEAATRWNFGKTMIESSDAWGNFILTESEDGLDGFEQYMQSGPNNEIYLSNPIIDLNVPNACLTYIAFYVVMDPDYEGERSIQIGAHLKGTGNNYGMDDQSVDLVYGSSSAHIVENTYVHSVASGTEQYFSIDCDLTFLHPNGTDQALVILGTRDDNMNVLALTNIKLNGYKLAENTAAELLAVQDVYDAGASILMGATVEIARALAHPGKED